MTHSAKPKNTAVVANVRITGRITFGWYRHPVPAASVRLFFVPEDGSDVDENVLEIALQIAVAETKSDRRGKYLLRLPHAPVGQLYLLKVSMGDWVGTRRIEVRSKPRAGATLVANVRLRQREVIMPLVSLPTVTREAIVRVFYVTDREKAADAGRFRNMRSRSRSLSFGEAEVSIPASHKRANVERPGWWNLGGETYEDHFVIVIRREHASDNFFMKVNAGTRSSPQPDVFVFIHGYNVSFDDALFRTAQLVYDLDFRGVPILYSWPSRASVLGYVRDLNQADWSASHCADFLERLARQSAARTIHIVAHSMGSRVLAHALRDMDPAAPLRGFREIVLAAPDIDAELFEGLAGAMASAARRVTLYASSNDWALWLSKFFNGARRAGDSKDLTLVESTDTIDASNVARGDWLHHSSYGNCTSVLDDMTSVMLGVDADKRPGLRRIELPPNHYWAFATIAVVRTETDGKAVFHCVKCLRRADPSWTTCPYCARFAMGLE